MLSPYETPMENMESQMETGGIQGIKELSLLYFDGGTS